MKNNLVRGQTKKNVMQNDRINRSFIYPSAIVYAEKNKQWREKESFFVSLRSENNLSWNKTKIWCKQSQFVALQLSKRKRNRFYKKTIFCETRAPYSELNSTLILLLQSGKCTGVSLTKSSSPSALATRIAASTSTARLWCQNVELSYRTGRCASRPASASTTAHSASALPALQV